MSVARTILVALIAVAVAAMPASTGFMLAGKASENAPTHAVPVIQHVIQIAAIHPAAMPADCDHHMPPSDPGSKPTEDCASMAACVAHCFSYSGTVVPVITPAPIGSRLQPVAAAGLVTSRIGSPPFRPPRV